MYYTGLEEDSTEQWPVSQVDGVETCTTARIRLGSVSHDKSAVAFASVVNIGIPNKL